MKMDARRRAHTFADTVKWALHVKSKEDREIAKMIKQAQRASKGDAATTKYASKVKVSTEGFRPYDARGIVTTIRPSTTSDVKVPIGSLYAASESMVSNNYNGGGLVQYWLEFARR